ncbi:MAG TPA: hypothetical protein VHA13_06095 [Gammaproteobacteria bacterium]|nr:hypothetical protein [Gammaproteobacteria bacterium]
MTLLTDFYGGHSGYEVRLPNYLSVSRLNKADDKLEEVLRGGAR